MLNTAEIVRSADCGERSKVRALLLFSFTVTVLFASPVNTVSAEEVLDLQPLIEEALRNNHDLLAAEAKWRSATHRTGQAESLPDPMIMIGYQNEGWDKYTFGKMEGAQWMYSVSQMFPFPGKRGIKGEMAAEDAAGSEAMYHAQRLKTVAAVKELYFDLFLAHKDIDIVRDKAALFSRIEEAALARYASGMAPQQEVLMAQAEKYMLLERETMLKQRVQSLEIMLNATIGRDPNTPLGRPAEPAVPAPFSSTLEELQTAALSRSPEIRSRERMIGAAEARVGMANREYYPDINLAASVFKRTGEFEDMWSLTATFNIPLYFGTKKQAVLEAREQSTGARHELEAARIMVASGVKDNYTMLRTAEKLMELYRQGLIPKTAQDVESALTGYRAGRVEAITVVSRLKALLDYETLYWAQFTEREKTIARIEALTGTGDQGSGDRSQESGARNEIP